MVAAYYACKRALVGGPREPRAQHQTKPGANMLEPMVTRPHDLDPPPVAGASGDTAAPVLELSADNSMPLPWGVGARAVDSQFAELSCPRTTLLRCRSGIPQHQHCDLVPHDESRNTVNSCNKRRNRPLTFD